MKRKITLYAIPFLMLYLIDRSLESLVKKDKYILSNYNYLVNNICPLKPNTLLRVDNSFFDFQQEFNYLYIDSAFTLYLYELSDKEWSDTSAKHIDTTLISYNPYGNIKDFYTSKTNVLIPYIYKSHIDYEDKIWDMDSSFVQYLFVQYDTSKTSNERISILVDCNNNFKVFSNNRSYRDTMAVGDVNDPSKIVDFTRKSYDAKVVNVSCCVGHNPKHCCKSLKQMADTTKKYSCVWP